MKKDYLKMMDDLTEEGIAKIKEILEHYKNYPKHLKGLSESQIKTLTESYEVLIDLNNEIYETFKEE